MFSKRDEVFSLVLQTGRGQDDQFVLRSCALSQGALANTVKVLAFANNLHFIHRDGPVFPGFSDASVWKLAESLSEVIKRIGKERLK